MNLLGNVARDVGNILHHDKDVVQIKGTVVLMKKNVLDFTDLNANALDNIQEMLGQGVDFQLASSTHEDKLRGNRGQLSQTAPMEDWVQILPPLAAGESIYHVKFQWNVQWGAPGALLVKNKHFTEFLLKTVTLEDVPTEGRVVFVCNSWIYPFLKYKSDRVFFSNKSYLPNQTPKALLPYRQDELTILRGNGTGELQEWDREYDYAYYNDLGQPEKGANFVRPVLGGSQEHPYPRRGRTGRKPNKADPKTESRLGLTESLNIYVPRDERFGHVKMADFLTYALKSVVQVLIPAFKSLFHKEFGSFQDVRNLYEGGIQLPSIPVLDNLKNAIPFEVIREILRSDGERFLQFPTPQIIQADKSAWRTDEEFGREMLAGVNPVIIKSLDKFPPTSNLDPKVYGDHTSTIKEQDIEKNLEGISVFVAIATKRLFILDHHDAILPYVNRINANTDTKLYATRTVLFLKNDGTLAPLAIELSLPNPAADWLGPVSKVYTPAEVGVESSVWQLAKAYVAVTDSGYHQLISHWLNTHAVIEPFVIATNRQLSVMHPIHKLLVPHYRDTMTINAEARQILINAGGLLESTVFPGKYALEMSSVVYKDWKLTEQGLPADLLKRGIAVKDSSQPHGLRLLIEDYPYAVDGLEIWYAIEEWVTEYCGIYYKDDATLQSDTEIQAWWTDIKEKGHGDKKDETWWPKLHTVADLVDVCTTIIWVASALHAAVNFGQYPFAGYLPNRPTTSRRFMPEPGTKDYAELEKNPDGFFLKTITAQFQILLGISLIEILSRHASDEVYLGQNAYPEWTGEKEALDAFKRFGKKLVAIENRILETNNSLVLKNRSGPARVPYTLLYPNTSDFSGIGGLTGRGIPNSISI